MEKRKVPALRFKDFTQDWEQRKLQKWVGATYGGGTPATANNEFWDGDIPWIQSSNVVEGELFDVDVKKYLSKNGVMHSAAQLIPENSVAVVTHVGVGKLVFMSYSYTTSQDFISLSDLKCVPKFLCYTLYKKLQEDLHVVQGSAIKGITKEDLMSKQIFLPDIDEQRRIAGALLSLDHFITLHQRKLEKLKKIKKSMLEKMFPKNNEKIPEIRFSAFFNDWEQRKLGELVSFAKGHGYSKSSLVDEGVPIVLYGRLYTDYETIIKKLDTRAIPLDNSVYSIGGEVVVPASGETADDIAIASVVENAGVLLGGDLNILYPSNNINPTFLAINITSGKPHCDIAQKAQGKSVVHVHNDDLAKVNLHYPNIKEQEKISNFQLMITTLITLHQRKLEKLKKIKKSMLEKMFI